MVQHAFLVPGSPGIPSREQTITRRTANGSRRICVEQSHALAREPVHVRRNNFRFGMVTTDVTPSLIVGEDEHDVWTLCRPNAEGGAERQPNASECVTNTKACDEIGRAHV